MSAWIDRLWRPLLGGAWLLALGALTLGSGDMRAEQLSEVRSLCLICGSRGAADAILNVALFAPLGVVLGGRSRSFLSAVAVGLAISIAIEVTQTVLPGRHASLADILWNSFGAGLGTVLHSTVAKRLDGRLRLGAMPWGATLFVGFLAAGILMIPYPTEDDYWGQWTPDLGSMPPYDGEVLTAALSERPLPSGRIDHPGPDRELLAGDWELTGRIVVGEPPGTVSPILSIYDGHQREMILLGGHRDDLVFRENMVGTHLRFDAPDIRIPGAFGSLSPGDTTRIAAERSEGLTCLRLGSIERCGVGVTAGRTWGLLLYLEGPGEPFRVLVDLLWPATLFFPIGFFGGSRADRAGSTVLGMAGLVLAILLTPLVAGSWYELAACLTGVALGRLGFVALRRLAVTPGQSTATASMASND